MKPLLYPILLAIILLAGGNEIIVDHFSQKELVCVSLEIECEEKTGSETEEKPDEYFSSEPYLIIWLSPIQYIPNRQWFYRAPVLLNFDIPPEA